MSRLITKIVAGGLIEATGYVNFRKLAKYVVVMQAFETPLHCTIVFRVPNYSTYVKVCEKLLIKPIEQSEY